MMIESEVQVETSRQGRPGDEARVEHAEGKARTSDPHVLDESKVEHLMLAALVVEEHGRFLLVGFHAAHIVWLLHHHTTVTPVQLSIVHLNRINGHSTFITVLLFFFLLLY